MENMKNVIAQIVEQRKKDIASRGYNFGFEIPKKRTRPVNPFMAERGVILEVKRASPSKGDIAPDLNPAETALKYRANGAKAISCLTEENYFKGSLADLMAVCAAVPDVAVLRKDFLIDEREIEIAYLCGADAVLLISGILSLEKMKSMTAKCAELGIRAFVEVRTEDDAEKVLEAKKNYPNTIVCGVNSRNLKDFSIDLLVPAQLKKKLGGDVIFESGITTPDAAEKIGSMGFSGILLGEFAARNPEKAGEFVRAFESSKENLYGRKMISLAEKVYERRASVSGAAVSQNAKNASGAGGGIAGAIGGKISSALASALKNEKNCSRPLVKICGLTRVKDVLLADSLGADFVGFIFASGFARNVYGKKFSEIGRVLAAVKAFKVGVITNPESEEAFAAAEFVKIGVLDFIQIHGIPYENVPDYLKKVPHYFALTEKMGDFAENAQKLTSRGEPRFLQDSKSHSYSADENGHLWLAGGVTAENVRSLYKKYKPELVDVSGGIEGGIPGEKDEAKMTKFFENLGSV